MNDLKSEALESLSNIVHNNMSNVFNALWAEAEKAGEVADTEEFIKGFVKAASKEMFKKGWVKSSACDFLEATSLLDAEKKEGFKVLLYVRLEDVASYSLTYGHEDGGLKEVVRSKCFCEAIKLYRKWLG